MLEDSERYADAVIRDRINENQAYNWCSRKRCNNTCNTQKVIDEHPDRYWRYDDYVVIVSLEDGTKKHAFCSRYCASLWLMSQGK